jgi:quinol-cytochrome oxidoreductase complex cytochrome b subunit
MMTLLVLQGVGGALLSLNYIPVMEELQALKSVQSIGATVKFGWFFQTLHKQCVHSIVIVSILLMILNIRKEEITVTTIAKWWGSVLTVLIILFAVYSGNILVGDGYASQSYQIGGNIVNEIPLIGVMLHFLLFSSNQQELQTFSLVRMYVNHILFLPILLGTVLYLQKPRELRENLTPIETIITILSVILVQITFAFLLPLNTKTIPYQPDWFFLPIHYLQQHIPSIITGLIIGSLLLSVLFLPIIYRKKREGL